METVMGMLFDFRSREPRSDPLKLRHADYQTFNYPPTII
jgi:hypothetical protein